jgi:hypothetical protein
MADQIVEESNWTVNMSAIRRRSASGPAVLDTLLRFPGGYRFGVRQFADQGSTIERERFARMTAQQEEIESSGPTFALEIGNLIRQRLHALLLVTSARSF